MAILIRVFGRLLIMKSYQRNILILAVGLIVTLSLIMWIGFICAIFSGATPTGPAATMKTALSTDQIIFTRVGLSQCPTRLLRMVNENQICGCTKLSVQEHMVCLNRSLTSATTLTEILSTTGGPIFDGLRDR